MTVENILTEQLQYAGFQQAEIFDFERLLLAAAFYAPSSEVQALLGRVKPEFFDEHAHYLVYLELLAPGVASEQPGSPRVIAVAARLVSRFGGTPNWRAITIALTNIQLYANTPIASERVNQAVEVLAGAYAYRVRRGVAEQLAKSDLRHAQLQAILKKLQSLADETVARKEHTFLQAA